MSQPPNTMSSRPASGTNSLIFGERPSVRLPRRIVPICVSEPIGFARPLRMAMTPAMVVVLTAPRPTSRTPSLPRRRGDVELVESQSATISWGNAHVSA